MKGFGKDCLCPGSLKRPRTTGAGNSFLVRGPDVLGSLWDKAGRAGRLEVMREVVYDMISTLRLGVVQMQGESNSKMLEVPERCSNLQTLREELEMSNAGE